MSCKSTTGGNRYAVDFPSVWKVNYVHPAVEQQIAKEQYQEAADCLQDGGLFDVDAFC